MATSRPQGKNWCFTFNNPDMDDLQMAMALHCSVYAVWQLEEGESGTPHYQGYAMFDDRLRLSQVRAFLPLAHWEVAKGTPKQNKEYCTKEPRIAPFAEIGIFPETAQGKRTDLDSLHSALKDGLGQADYANNYFSLFVRYPNLVTNYVNSQVAPRTGEKETECWLFIGRRSETGKSRLARGLAELLYGDSVYRKFPGKWWDGYSGQTAVILDDFRGSSLSFTDFKLCVDRYPLRVEVKGSTCHLAATHFFITSNFEPFEWWSPEIIGPDHSPIFRRITKVFYMPLPGKVTVFPSYANYHHHYHTPQVEKADSPLTLTVPPLVEINWDAPQEILS